MKNQSETMKSENELNTQSNKSSNKKSTDEKSLCTKNFRTSFYSKVGLGNDEEKIDALLNPADIDKIKMYIKTYSIPDLHRFKIWKLLLGMTTSNGDDNYTSELRKISYDNLFKCLTFLGNLSEQTTSIDRNVIIYKFEDDKLYHPKNYVVSV